MALRGAFGWLWASLFLFFANILSTYIEFKIVHSHQIPWADSDFTLNLIATWACSVSTSLLGSVCIVIAVKLFDDHMQKLEVKDTPYIAEKVKERKRRIVKYVFALSWTLLALVNIELMWKIVVRVREGKYHGVFWVGELLKLMVFFASYALALWSSHTIFMYLHPRFMKVKTQTPLGWRNYWMPPRLPSPRLLPRIPEMVGPVQRRGRVRQARRQVRVRPADVVV